MSYFSSDLHVIVVLNNPAMHDVNSVVSWRGGGGGSIGHWRGGAKLLMHSYVPCYPVFVTNKDENNA